MKTFKIVNDSGVDYNFLAGFGHPKTSWLGQIVKGNTIDWAGGSVIVEKPFGIAGTYTAPASHFEEIK